MGGALLSDRFVDANFLGGGVTAVCRVWSLAASKHNTHGNMCPSNGHTGAHVPTKKFKLWHLKLLNIIKVINPKMYIEVRFHISNDVMVAKATNM